MQIDFSKAFIDGRIVETENGKVTFKTHQIEELIVPSGYIVACDPFVFFDSVAFTKQIPVGTFPVILSVANFNDNDQRVAYARLQISNEPTISWEMALIPNQDISTLKEDEFFGYSVDAGIGCFMDAETAAVFLKKLEDEVWREDYSYSDFMLNEMKKNYVPTWDWGNFKLDETVGNLITFSSGLGDGAYPSYFGFDARGNVTSLVTDFQVIKDAEVHSDQNIYVDFTEQSYLHFIFGKTKFLKVERLLCRSVNMPSIRILDKRELNNGSVLSFDLEDILNIIGERVLTSRQGCQDLYYTATRNGIFAEIREPNLKLSGEEFMQLAQSTHQTIDGRFEARGQGAAKNAWLIITAFDSSWFDVWSSKPTVIESIKTHFKEVIDLPNVAN